jgi:mono/diheme cytochrome c family protein
MRTNIAHASRVLPLASMVLSATVLALLSMAGFAAEPREDAVEGKRLFLAYGCYQCHGTTGAGGGMAGPKLAPNPLPVEVIKAKLRTASGRMPVYTAAVLTDSEIADMVAYLQSIPRGTPAEDIPLLNR